MRPAGAVGADAAVQSAAVLYTDYLMKVPGKWHRHRCRQHLTIGAGGRVVRIVHEDLPGEKESLEAYFRECGIEG